MANIDDLDNFYELLGLEPHASAEEIRSAYRTRARQVHPDVAGPRGTAEFVRLNRAYETLIDPRRRRAYDERFRAVWRRARVGRSTGASEWFGGPLMLESLLVDLVAGMQEGARGRPLPARSPVHVELVLAPETARRGTEVRLDLPVTVICQNCRGTGLAEPFICPACRGKGRWPDTRQVRFFLPPPIRDGQIVSVNLGPADVAVGELHIHVRLSWL